MGKIRITLLVPRQPQDSRHPYALEITYSYHPIPDDEILLTEARLLDQHGKRASEAETWGAYHPEEWRAATQQEQQEYLLRFGSPKPWFATLHRIYKSVYYFPDSGDESSNNGQTWSENLDDEWEEEEKLRDRFREEKEAWRERVGESGTLAQPLLANALLYFAEQQGYDDAFERSYSGGMNLCHRKRAK